MWVLVLLWIFVIGLSDRRGLEIKIGSNDWRLAVIAWWFEDQRRWHSGLEWRRWWILSLSLILILSFSHSDSLSQIGYGFWFCFEFFASSIWIVLLFFFFFWFCFVLFCYCYCFFFFVFCFFFVLILLLGFQFLMQFVFHRELEFFLLGCLICKVSNKGK